MKVKMWRILVCIIKKLYKENDFGHFLQAINSVHFEADGL